MARLLSCKIFEKGGARDEQPATPCEEHLHPAEVLDDAIEMDMRHAYGISKECLCDRDHDRQHVDICDPKPRHKLPQ